jgi:hypothetical protein
VLQIIFDLLKEEDRKFLTAFDQDLYYAIFEDNNAWRHPDDAIVILVCMMRHYFHLGEDGKMHAVSYVIDADHPLPVVVKDDPIVGTGTTTAFKKYPMLLSCKIPAGIVNQKKVDTAIAAWYVESVFRFLKPSVEDAGLGSATDLATAAVATENRRLKELFWKTDTVDFAESCPVGQLKKQDGKFYCDDIFAYLDKTSRENDGKCY